MILVAHYNDFSLCDRYDKIIKKKSIKKNNVHIMQFIFQEVLFIDLLIYK